MSDSDWRARVREKISANGTTMRDVSLRAGFNAAYVQQMLKSEKDPAIGNFIRVADALNVSATWLMFGITMSRKDERLLRLFAIMTDEEREAFLSVGEAMSAKTRHRNSK